MPGEDGEGALGPDLYSETCAPMVMRWRRFRVLSEKMVQDMKEGQDMLPIAPELCFSNIIDNHIADFFGSILLRKKVTRESRCCYFRYVLVFDDGEHLLLGQATKLDTIFHRDHGINASSSQAKWAIRRGDLRI